MGLFENSKMKKEAKRLGLTIEQYEGYLSVEGRGLSVDAYKRFLYSFTGRYTIEQFIDYLRLEKAGFTPRQCSRYIFELADDISVADYAQFLEVEKLGMTVAEFTAYAALMKDKMSAVEFLGYRKAQKIGVTLEDYLTYLKSFQAEMSIEDYLEFRKAEPLGMTRTLFAEYLTKYKHRYTVERFLDFDKARDLGLSLEDFDLLLQAEKLDMSLAEYKHHLEAEKLGLTDREYTLYLDVLENGRIAAGVFTVPQTYAELSRRVLKLLDFHTVVIPDSLVTIPDWSFAGWEMKKVTISATVQTVGESAFTDCKKLANVVFEGVPATFGRDLFSGCKALKKIKIEGVEITAEAFDKKYKPKAVRTAKEPAAPKRPKKEKKPPQETVIKEKQEAEEITVLPPPPEEPAVEVVTPEPAAEPTPKPVEPVAEEPAKKKPPKKAPVPKAESVQYLPGQEPANIQKRLHRLFEKLDSVYPDKVVVGLHKDHKKWGEAVTELYRLLGYPNGNAFLKAYGYRVSHAASGGRPSADPKEVVAELKRRYADGPTCATMADLAKENPDLAPRFSNMQNQADKFFGMTLAKYFVQEGILQDKKALARDEKLVAQTKSAEGKLEAMTQVLKARYGDGKPKARTLTELREQNMDLPIHTISRWTKKVHGQTATEYLIAQGILQD